MTTVISGYAGDSKPDDDFSVVIVKRLTVRGVDGLENAPLVLNRLFDGSHTGKLVLRVDTEV
jgi:NADPH-dependent curcumin reductase CurA